MPLDWLVLLLLALYAAGTIAAMIKSMDLVIVIFTPLLEVLTLLVRGCYTISAPLCALFRPLRSPQMSIFELVLELPAALLSFVVFKIAKYLFSRPIDEAPGWGSPYGAITVWNDREPYKLIARAVLMPRWQTRALTARTALKVNDGFEIDVGALANPTLSWSCLVQTSAGAPVASLCGDGRPTASTEWVRVPLEAGDYVVYLRCYTEKPNPKDVPLPAIRLGADATPVVAATSGSIDLDGELELEKLAPYQIPFLRAVHFHIYPMIAWGQLLPPSLLNRTVLDDEPEPAIAFGTISAGCAMVISLKEEAVAEFHVVHVTIYNRHSFPVNYFDLPLTSAPYTTLTFEEDGIYVVRGIFKRPGGPSVTSIDPSNSRARSPEFGSRITIGLIPTH
mmetsp:Transcript_5877/g.12097  ORF Transcript_5877/g.12097 Transcript_5877/m.12097 type:complete len:393 (+) Transcript_5877:295-1473(+)